MKKFLFAIAVCGVTAIVLLAQPRPLGPTYPRPSSVSTLGGLTLQDLIDMDVLTNNRTIPTTLSNDFRISHNSGVFFAIDNDTAPALISYNGVTYMQFGQFGTVQFTKDIYASGASVSIGHPTASGALFDSLYVRQGIFTNGIVLGTNSNTFIYHANTNMLEAYGTNAPIHTPISGINRAGQLFGDAAGISNAVNLTSAGDIAVSQTDERTWQVSYSTPAPPTSYEGEFSGDGIGLTNLNSSLTNLLLTDIMSLPVSPAGPKHSYYSALVDITFTNISGHVSTNVSNGIALIDNNSGSNLVITIPNEWFTIDALRTYTVTNAHRAVVYVLAYANLATNASFADLQ